MGAYSLETSVVALRLRMPRSRLGGNFWDSLRVEDSLPAVSFDGDRFALPAYGPDLCSATATTTVTTEPGKLYELSATGLGTITIAVGTAASGTNILAAATYATARYFTAVGTTTHLTVTVTTGSLTDILVREVMLGELGANLGASGYTMSVNGGTGTATESPSGQLNLTGDGTNPATGDRQLTGLTVGAHYRVVFLSAGTAVAFSVGTTQGGTDTMPLTAQAVTGIGIYEFTATATAHWVRFRRTAASLTTISSITIAQWTPRPTLRTASFGEVFAYTASSTTARTYVGSDGLIKNDLAADAPRWDFSNGKARLLLENASTNLLLRSAEFNDAAWIKSGTTITTGAGISPDGSLNANKLAEDTSTGLHRVLQQVSKAASSLTYTLSVFLKAAERTEVLLVIDESGGLNGSVANVDLSAGTITLGSPEGTGFSNVGAAITPLAGGWYRAAVTITSNTGTTVRGQVRMRVGGLTSYAGTTGSGVLMYGFQLEQQSFASSYIPTAAATVTRLIETARFSPLVEAIFRQPGVSARVQASIPSPTTGARRVLGQSGAASAAIMATDSNNAVVGSWNGATNLTANAGSGGWTDGGGATIGINSSGRSVALNAGAVGSDTAFLDRVTPLYLARNTTVGVTQEYGDGYYNSFALYPFRISNANLPSLAVPAGSPAPGGGSIPASAPVNTSPPVISDLTPDVGETLSVTTGSWSGNPVPTFTYAWLRDGTPISGATSASYTVVEADVGKFITARVTATNSQGSAQANSQTTIAVPPVEAPPTTVRYIRPSGTGNGTNWASAAPLSNLNTMIQQAGPGGTVYIRADEGTYNLTGGVTITSGGTSGNPVIVAGVDVNLAPMKASISGGRQFPWLNNGGPQGDNLITLGAGANHIQFRSLHLRDAKFAVRAGDRHTGITFGNPTYRDTAVAALIPTDVFFDRDASDYFTRVDAIYAASATGVSADIQNFAVDMTNVYRGIDCGDPASFTTTDTFFDFQIYGGVYTGSARGFFRLRGDGRGLWFQDMTMDGQGPTYKSEDGSFCVGVELNGIDGGGPGQGMSNCVFLRCTANNHRATTWGSYSNGDGFSGERENLNTCYIRCTANGNEDGGLETKAGNVTAIGFTAGGNRRNFRLWGDSDLFYITSNEPDATGRANTDRRHIFTESSTGWQRVFSGTFTSTTGSPLMGSGGVRAFIAVHTGVTLNLNGAATGESSTSTVRRIITNLFSTTTPEFTSEGSRSIANGTGDSYSPAASLPSYFRVSGGPDAALISGDHSPFVLSPRFFNFPEDTNGNNTYEYTLEALTAARTRGFQNVLVTVQPSIPTTPGNNLFESTEAFDASAWLKSGVTVSPNVALDPFGNTLSADKMVMTTLTSGVKALDGNLLTMPASGTEHTLSFYVKPDGHNFVQLRVTTGLSSNAHANFDILNGVVGSGTGTTNRAITSVGNGWYRVSATFTPNAGVSGRFVIALSPSNTAGRSPSLPGDGTSGILVWGAQVEPGTALTAYSPRN